MRAVKICAVGDLCLGDHLLCTGFGIRSQIKSKGNDFLLKNVKSYLKNSDLCFGNLECVLSNVNCNNKNLFSIHQDLNIVYNVKMTPNVKD